MKTAKISTRFWHRGKEVFENFELETEAVKFEEITKEEILSILRSKGFKKVIALEFKLQTEWKFIVCDETRYWDKSLVSKLGQNGKIVAVYAFDANCQVHCCELTPSYELFFLGQHAEFEDGLEERLGENAYQALMSEIENENAPDSDVSYQYCSDVDRMNPKDITGASTWDKYDDIRELYNSNPWC